MKSNEHLLDSHIMIVDDNPINVEVLQVLLQAQGYAQLQGICDPRQVEPACKLQLPDLVLLDIQMPHLSGQVLLQRLRAHWGDRCPPIIVLTAHIDESTRHQALAAGARDFISKPFNHQEVLQRISNILASHHSYKQRVSEASALESLVAQRTAEIQRQALREPVTGLPNRRAVIAELEQALVAPAAVNVAFIAVDAIDDIARLHGYPVTEQLIALLGRIMGQRLQNATLGCWGNAEFVCFQRETHAFPPFIETLQALQQALSRTFQVGDLRLGVTLRIGVSRSGHDSDYAEQLIRFAALALPERTGEPPRLFDEDLEHALQQRDRLHRALRSAVSNQELHLLYQPKICLREGRIVGAEALLRWEHPELGTIPPRDFIPLAEGSGEILTLGRWVLETAISQAAAWQRADLCQGDFTLALNVSARQLALPDLADEITGLMQIHRLESRFLELEVTESGLMDDIVQAGNQLQILAQRGVSIAIDDFGTGYSSLAYLKNLPVHTLKIDRAFVDGIAQNSQDRNLAKTVIAMARNFHCRTVGEGVEHPEQARLLKELGADTAQGYWFAHPMPAEDFARLCREPPDWSF
ncbi:MAG: GGDEF domain-containing response regulator [Halomonadaceae bacterium]|nr:MAG: GGDEF domain-containing response regulator [Halomonadaceae bacterium]